MCPLQEMKRRELLILALAAAAAGCRDSAAPRRTDPAANPAASKPEKAYQSALIDGVGHIVQKPDFCGEAIAAAYLRHLGKHYSQDDVFALSRMDPARGMGATTREMRVALEQAGFAVGPVWHQVDVSDAAAQLEALFASMHTDLLAGIPSIVCMHYDDQPRTTEHFRLVLGYDDITDEVLYHEPAVAGGAYKRMKRALLLKLWPLKYAAAKWTVIRFRLAPRALREPPARPAGHSPADFAQHVMKLNKRLPAGFNLVIEPPFVVIGNDRPSTTKRYAETTVRWAVEKLKKAYFSKDPKHILDVWLFKDKESYMSHATRLFGKRPTTPFGYYTARHRALVMNIKTGGGTLVHEIVHPFIESNFPACPAWLNEGLGSLYEQSASRGEDIVGLTNWRLAGLQKAIARRRVPSFKTLTATTRSEFYDEDPGTNYAQARYLLYYLQEHGLLRRFYRAFHDKQATDPTGFETLKSVLGEKDMVAFKKRWEQYVSRLRFP